MIPQPIWNTVDWSQRNQQIADAIGAAYVTVKISASLFEGIDWELTDQAIHLQAGIPYHAGITRERMRQLRKAEGLPSTKTLHAPSLTNDEMGQLKPHLVKCDGYQGLTPEIAAEAVRRLNAVNQTAT